MLTAVIDVLLEYINLGGIAQQTFGWGCAPVPTILLVVRLSVNQYDLLHLFYKITKYIYNKKINYTIYNHTI